jgi:hypothetical protein
MYRRSMYRSLAVAAVLCLAAGVAVAQPCRAVPGHYGPATHAWIPPHLMPPGCGEAAPPLIVPAPAPYFVPAIPIYPGWIWDPSFGWHAPGGRIFWHPERGWFRR